MASLMDTPHDTHAPPTAKRRLRRLAIAIAGTTVILAGIAMVPLPGPAIVVIPAGISILALEFNWARRLRDRGKKHLDRFARKR